MRHAAGARGVRVRGVGGSGGMQRGAPSCVCARAGVHTQCTARAAWQPCSPSAPTCRSSSVRPMAGRPPACRCFPCASSSVPSPLLRPCWASPEPGPVRPPSDLLGVPRERKEESIAAAVARGVWLGARQPRHSSAALRGALHAVAPSYVALLCILVLLVCGFGLFAHLPPFLAPCAELATAVWWQSSSACCSRCTFWQPAVAA